LGGSQTEDLLGTGDAKPTLFWELIFPDPDDLQKPQWMTA
jgi:hypothetical protein